MIIDFMGNIRNFSILSQTQLPDATTCIIGINTKEFHAYYTAQLRGDVTRSRRSFFSGNGRVNVRYICLMSSYTFTDT